ncbi:DHA2 family efflux MFS transporter permease subunit [Corynebacterium belfantii]|uniref:DHA2 family efflux MFS transporter permease subunit n=1 Tax=Corynebacterium belfantii TaxID=2014537 RepID=A0ABS0LF28_9CORY|nr:DHA2 family efflux MFS transporter permease subunit [Corynebacterium belfantii]QBZ30959.1 DHA2 family efflux MFS transporter permease subunit [Corynebacterium diphtheriae subsp. lausannense]MBG9243634.1 DHA2 family efflux MFS transporter permease subunit [Corynebacterium belfantii]MBG9258438.1 DHA2 family efflux MFS transporter permease subunit [Corynebacterium belfantii]MBG9265665.1 DHA2 family efflux MFS transporter permease subunit [Corynebacterium belfantii]MBG9299127.1 DHA2 family effl
MPLPEKEAWPALIALCIGFFMILLDQTIVAVATPALQADLHASYNEVIWLTSSYLLTFAVPLLITGRLGDRFGPKNIYIIGMVIFTLSSLACGFAPNMMMLISARTVQGIGASMLTPQTMSVINRVFACERRGAALGIWGSVAGIASLAGPILGGFITAWAGWQWIFFINVPIGVVSVFAVARFVPRFKPTERSIDGLSMVLSVVSVFALVFALQQGESAGWAWWIWVVMVVGIAVGVLFAYQQNRAEAKGKDALMPLSLFHVRNFSLGNIGIAAMGFTIAGTPLPIMLYLQQVHSLTPLQAGLFMMPQALISAFFSPLIGHWSDHYSTSKLAGFGFSTMAVGLALIAAVMIIDVNLWWLVPAFIVYGLGNAFVWSPNSTSTMRDLPIHHMGVGSGVYNTTRQIGSVIGSAAIGAVLQWRIMAGDMSAAYGQSIILGAVVLAVGFVSAMLAQNKPRR